ncbi:MAG: N-acetylglucosamine-6-phosphate deacetylase [Nocardioidaceae bacterium]
MSALVFRNARLFTGSEVVEHGWVVVADGRVTGLGPGSPPDSAPGSPGGAEVDLDGDWLVPGFVDVHVHGGGGGDFMSPDPEGRRTARELHLRHGTTALLASTVSTPADVLLAAVGRLAEDADAQRYDGRAARLLGIHLEGPFLSHRRRGAHDETYIRDPDPAELARLVEHGRGWVRTLTVAPELPGGTDLVRAARAAGVVVALGHTDAGADQVRAAVEAGVSAVTHTFNGMRPLHHREPGAVGMAMDLDALTCELILDLVHVDPVAARALVHAAGPARVCLVTDAMAAAGMADGRYELGGAVVDVVDRRVLVPGTDTLAGSTLTMDEAVRHAVTTLRLDVPTAVSMATAVPARLLGRDDVGHLRPGGPADLVRLDGDGRLRGVWASGFDVPPHDRSPTAGGD